MDIVAKSTAQTFGKYQILERIATGGMAEIYKAKLEGIGGFERLFAIKRILPHLSQNADYVAMLVEEAKVAGLLSHANIVQILDLGQVGQIWYIAMEYVHGADLGAALKRASKKGLCLPVPHAVFIILELLKGLEYAHKRQVMRDGKAVPLNIIHRDISPPNILLSFQGEVKLTDFGIARASHRMLETEAGVVKGRYDYMSPEQAKSAKDLDHRSDLFSVGIVLYQMLTGVHPFQADTELGTRDRIRLGQFEPVTRVNPSIPMALETIVGQALDGDRDKRFSSATVFKETLDQFFHDSGFIFTHATLATYVRGLFPEATVRSAMDDADLPTRGEVGEEDDIELNTLDKAGSASPFHNSLAPMDEEESEDPTLIRSNPLADGFHDPSQWDDEMPTVVGVAPETPGVVVREKAPPLDGDDQETLIRKSPLDDLPSLSLPLPVNQDRAKEDSVDTPSPVDEETPKVERVKAPAIGWLGWILAMLLLLIGLFVGSVAGVVSAHMLDLSGAGLGNVTPSQGAP